jgi:hypothetical protein
MQNREAFGLAMAALGVNCRTDVTEAQLELFWRFLEDLSDADFQRAVQVHIQTSRFFPTIAELREHVTPKTNPAAEAVLAFGQVVKSGTYSPTGTRWSIRRVAELVGPIAAEAFAAAGASSAFEQEQGERDLPYLRKRFVDAYVAAAEDLRAGRPLALSSTGTVIGPGDSRVRALIASTAKSLQTPK